MFCGVRNSNPRRDVRSARSRSSSCLRREPYARLVQRGHQSSGASSLPGHLSRPQGYQLDAGVSHSHPGTASASQRAIPRAGSPVLLDSPEGETHEDYFISSTPARLFPRLVGATTKCFPSHRAVLPGQLAAVSPLRRRTENEVRCQARPGRSHGGRGARVSQRHRTGSQVLDWNTELPIVGTTQLF